MAQILHNLSYKVCSITLPKFNKFYLFILILSTSAIMDQTACCYNVTTSETGLYKNVNANVLCFASFFHKVLNVKLLSY